MNDGRDPLDDALRTSGAAHREAGTGWVPDPADVARRSRRQTTTARRSTGAAMAVLVVLLVGAGLGLTRGEDGHDEDLTVAGMGTTAAPSTTTTASTSTSAVLVPDPGRDGSATTTTTDVGVTPTARSGAPTTRPGSTDGATTGDDAPTPPPTDSTTTVAVLPIETSIPAPDVTTTTTTTPPPVPPGVELRDDGLGIVTLGDDADEAASVLVAAFGPPRLATGWRADPNVGLVSYIIWGPTGGTDPNANQALVVRLVSTPSHESDGLVRYTYCPTPGFPHLLLPGGVDPGTDCVTRSL